jgi:hypothetical protein
VNNRVLDSENILRVYDRRKLDIVHGSVVGHGAKFQGPYGPKHLLYTDYAASGRALKPFEDYIQ